MKVAERTRRGLSAVIAPLAVDYQNMMFEHIARHKRRRVEETSGDVKAGTTPSWDRAEVSLGLVGLPPLFLCAVWALMGCSCEEGTGG